MYKDILAKMPIEKKAEFITGEGMRTKLFPEYGIDNYIEGRLNKSHSLIISIINIIPYCFISFFLTALIFSINNIFFKLIIVGFLLYFIYKIINIMKGI